MSRPNILMFMADQLPAATIGAYGHPVVKTPHLDALANAGVLFEQCYCPSPLCAPSRASMMTGKLPLAIKAFDNASELPAAEPTFVHHLRQAGYHTVLSGKMHFIGPDQLHGFEERLTTDIYPSGLNWTPDWRRGIHANPGSSIKALSESGLCDWGLQLDYDEETHFRATEKLIDLSRHRDDRPFFLCVSYTHPHDPFTITEKYWKKYDHSAIDMPAAPPDELEKLHPFNRWLQIHHEADRYPPTVEQIRNSRHAFYGMVSYFDEKVGELLGLLRRLNLHENTLVLLTSDHGEMLGEHGMWFKRTFFDNSVRIPFLVSWPGVWDKGRRIREAVSLLDIFPTLVDVAEVAHADEAKEFCHGRTLLPLLNGTAGEWPDYAISEYYGEGVIEPARMIVWGSHKYIHVHGQEPQLFDLAADPLELHNLAGKAEVKEVETRLRNKLLDGWDGEAAKRCVMQSQQERLMVREALSCGQPTPWDFDPPGRGSRKYVREFDAQQTCRIMRLPKETTN